MLQNRAEQDDQTGNYNKNTVKMYYVAGTLSDTLKSFGDVDAQLLAMGKYDKYKATAIHAAMKNGETPVRGAPGMFDDAVVPVGDVVDVTTTPEMPSVEKADTKETTTARRINYEEATKLVKYAISAMLFEDRVTAIKNLKQALVMLQAED